MRVCVLNNNFYRGSGITLVVRRLAESKNLGGVELFLASCGSTHGQDPDTERLDFVLPSHSRFFNLMSGPLGLIPAIFRFAKWLREINCDLIHVHHRRLAVIANVMGFFTGVDVLYSGHLTYSFSWWFKVLAPTRVTGVGPSVVDYLRRSTLAKEISLIYNPFPFPDRFRRQESAPTRRVVSIGRLEAVKDHATLIDAWRLLRERKVEAQLDIFGEGPLETVLQAKILESGLGDTVHLRGFVPDLLQRLPDYDFNVLVSETEGFPNAVVETASCGIPSLITNVAGSRDTLPDQLELPNGVRFRDPEALADALEMWLASPALIRADGERFYLHLKRLCMPATIERQYAHLYAEIVRSRRSRSGKKPDSQ